MLTALRVLAGAAFDALAYVSYPAADELYEETRRRGRPHAELTLLDEMADHLGTIRAQLEDIRNLLQQQNSLALGLPGLNDPLCLCVKPYPGYHEVGCPALRANPQPTK